MPFRYRFSSADYKAAADADQYAASVDVAATGLTLTAATFDHRALVIDLDTAELPDGKPYVTVEIDNTATVLLVSGWAFFRNERFAPPATHTV